MLKEMTLYGEVDKVKVAINRLKLHEPKEGYYAAFSGGKDSCVVLDLCKRAGVKYDVHYSVTNESAFRFVVVMLLGLILIEVRSIISLLIDIARAFAELARGRE